MAGVYRGWGHRESIAGTLTVAGRSVGEPLGTKIMRLLAVALACLALTACSKSATADLGHDVNVAGRDLKAEAAKIKTDPDIRRADADAKRVGHDLAASVRQAAADAKIEADKAGEKAKHTADDVKQDVHDDTKS